MTTALTFGTSTAEFLIVFNRLCIGLREQHDESGVTQGVYYDALKHLPLSVLRVSADQLATEPGRKYFPTTGEWIDVARAVLAKQQRDDSPVRANAGTHTWTVECSACDDSGCEYFECTGDTFCGRTQPHAKHTFARPCPCRETNRTYQRHQVNR